MKIELLHRYQGALTKEEVLLAGEHEVKDSIGQYLVDNGHAVIIEEQKPIRVTGERPTQSSKRGRKKE